MKGVEIRLDGTTLVVRIPMHFQRRGGRKRIVAAPDGSAIVPSSKPQPDRTLVKALARGASLAPAAGGRPIRHAGRARRRRTDQPLLRLPRPAAHTSRTRHRRTDPRRAADATAGSVPEAVPGRVGEAAESPPMTDAAARVSTAPDIPQILGEDRALTLARNANTRYGREV
jgi:hypothetical protein